MENLHELYAVVDLETTGSSFRKGHRIIQVGITMIQDGQMIQEYDFTVNPGGRIPPLIENLTGISNKDVRNAPYFEDIAAYLYGLLENCTFVAHNIAFDYHFLNQSFQAVGLPPMKQKGIDTVELSKILFPTMKSYRLGDLSTFFGLEHDHAHDALSDARATAQLFLRLKERAIQLPYVTLEKLCTLATDMQRDNREFLEKCREEALKHKKPLPEHIRVKNGIALRKKTVELEQTAYRLKENYQVAQAWPLIQEKFGYSIRDNQEAMMQEIEAYFRNQEKQFAVEAPPGTGKTYAYLLPAILNATPERKAVIATSTLLLQEQMEEVVEQLQAALPFSFTTTSLSSKTHLLNLERFEKIRIPDLTNTEVLVMMSLYVWLTETETGDLTELSPSHQAGTLLERIAFQKQDGKVASKWGQDDFYAYHHHKASQSSVLLTNHAYLAHHIDEISGWCQKGEAFLVVDEAHRLAGAFKEKEKNVFPVSLVKKRVLRFSNDVKNYREHLEQHASQTFPHYELINFEFAFDRLYQSLIDIEEDMRKMVWPHNDSPNDKKVEEKTISLEPEQITTGKFNRSLQKVRKHIQEVSLTGERYRESASTSKDSSFYQRTYALHYALQDLHEQLGQLIKEDPFAYCALSAERQPEYFYGELVKGKWFVGDYLSDLLAQHFDKQLYVSATLFLDGNADYFIRTIGAKELRALRYQLDEATNARKLHLFVPSDLTPIAELETDDWVKRMSSFLTSLAIETQQKMMVLFNANQALEGVFRELRLQMEQDDRNIDVLAQGYSGSRRRMHRRFVEAEQAVLLGSGMYWEGIDFPEKPVEILVITRLPFDAPNKPENLAMERYYRSVGKNVFREEFLPRMLIRLAQGLGRISRNESEVGVLVCLDTRLVRSPYAKQVKELLPEQTEINQTELQQVIEEIKKIREQ